MSVTMKKWVTVLVGVCALVLATSGSAFAQEDPPTDPCEVKWDLIAGQTINVGGVAVTNDATNLYVTYTLDTATYPNACFGTLHVWVGNNLLLLPSNDKGTPIPGQFCSADGGACFDAMGLTTYTFTIPFSELSISDVTQVCGSPLFVVTHAEVDLDCTDSDTEHETAFGGPIPGAGPRWWFYGSYNICCDFGPPEPGVCGTSYAKGTWVWTTDKKSNPENLPSLGLTRNRWGWAINLTSEGTTTYDIWEGAGLNRTCEKGNAGSVKVGTLTVKYESGAVQLTYNMFADPTACSGAPVAPRYIEEVHIYVGDSKPNTIAPGQYGYIDAPDGDPASYTSDWIEVSDSNGDGVWIVAHAVTCAQP